MIAGVGVYEALLLRPPGVRDPRNLLTVYVRSPEGAYGDVSTADFEFYREHNQSFSDVLAFQPGINWAITDNPDERVIGTMVSQNYFDVAGVRPLLGTLTFPPHQPDVVVISERLWRRRGSDPRIIGRTLRIHGDVRVMGVVPNTFTGMALAVWQPDAWYPILGSGESPGPDQSPPKRTDRWLHMIGRLKSGVPWAQADADVARLSDVLAAQYPNTDKDRRAFVAATTIVPADIRSWTARVVGGLAALGVLALLAAYFNVTQLLLGLGVTRRHEMLVRASLGASRRQLMAPLLREGLALGLVSGAFGCALGFGALRAISRYALSLGVGFPPVSFDFRPDLTVGVLACAMVFGVSLGIGLIPAWHAAAEGLSADLRRQVSIGGAGRARVRHALVVVQMTVATVVLVGVGLCLRNVWNLRHVDLGFSARNLAIADMNLEARGYTAATGKNFYDRLRASVSAVPGVESVSLVGSEPLLGTWARDAVRDAEAGSAQEQSIPINVVDQQYFSTIHMPVLAGRTFDARDTPTSPEVVIVNRTLARRFWPDGDPIGRRLHIRNGNRIVQVVGEVVDSRYGDLDEEPQPFIYFALGQHYLGDLTLIARTARSAPLFTRAIGDAIRTLDSGQGAPPPVVRSFKEDDLRLAMIVPMLMLAAASGLGALALLLTLVGLYGSIAHGLSLRRAELGVRIALGARPRDLFGMILRYTAALAGLGCAGGIIVSQVSVPIVSSAFYGIRPVETGVLLAVVIFNLGIALAISYLVVRPWTRMSAMDIVRQR